MAAKNVLGIIFSNAYDNVVPELTALRTMGSVPFAARYRLIDFQLSGMVNAGIPMVGIITNSNYRSLMDHLGNGKPWDLSRKREGLTLLPPFSSPESGMFKDKADALYGSIEYISNSGKDYVLIADCNEVGNIDYEAMIKCCTANNADAVIAYAHGKAPKLSNATDYKISPEGLITEITVVTNDAEDANYSLKTMVIKRTLLERLLHEAAAKRINDFETLLANNVGSLRIYGFEHKGYIKVIESISSYYEASLDLLKPEVRKSLFTAEKPVFTKTNDRVPAKYGITSKVSNSLIADGCKIYGEVENCVLFRGVTVSKGAKVKNSIIMQDTFIGENADINCVITDKDVRIGNGKKLSGAENYPVYIGKAIVI